MAQIALSLALSTLGFLKKANVNAAYFYKLQGQEALNWT